MSEAGLTFGWTIFGGVLTGILILTALLWGAAWLRSRALRGSYYGGWDPLENGWVVGGTMLSVISGLVLVAATITWFVIPPENRVNYTVSGTVQGVSNRFVEGTGDLTGAGFTFRLDGSDEVLYTQSTRIQAMDGEHVDLLCTLEWVPRGADYYHCILNDNEGK